LGGIGLHTADYTYVRLRPAPPGDGRYFAIVPKGFISESFSCVSERDRIEDGDKKKYPDTSEKNQYSRTQDRAVEAFLAYHEAKSKNYSGSVEEFEEEFFTEENSYMLEKSKNIMDMDSATEDFETLALSQEDIVIPATLPFARGEYHCTVLENNGFAVHGVEHLLAALEACGVDNCRIELEGGREVPIIDGSSHGWTTMIIRAGVVACKEYHRKEFIKVQKPIVVTGDRGSFITVTPSETPLLTAGWDSTSSGAPFLGRCWFTWDVLNDFHFHYSVAPAKTFYHSEFELDLLYDSGLVQAGPTYCAIVGMGNSFQDPGEVTFPNDETARHKVIDLTGDLALLTLNGHWGLPVGHFVAWNANHVLQLKFCTKLWNEYMSADKVIRCKQPHVQIERKMNTHLSNTLNLEPGVEKFSNDMIEEEEVEDEALRRVQTTLGNRSVSDKFNLD